MRCQRKPSITYTYYATASLLLLLPHSPSWPASLSSWPQSSSALLPSFPSLFFCFAFCLHSSQFTSCLHLFFPPAVWKHLRPAACFLCECVCVQVRGMQVTIWHPCLCTVLFLRQFIMNLWWEEPTYQQDVLCWKTRNPKQACSHLPSDSRVLRFNLLNSCGGEAVHI